jgi:hypothetical protein
MHATERRAALGTLLLLVLAVAVAGCGDQVQKAKPPEKPQAPTTGMPEGHPPIGQAPASRPAGGDPFAESGHGGQPGMDAAKPSDPERVVVAGEISIDPAVKLGEQYTVYITTTYGQKERAPVLLKRYEAPKFPFQFEIREKDVGMGNRGSDRPLWVHAMISDTGDAMKSRNRTSSDTSYPPFTKDIKLTIKP